MIRKFSGVAFVILLVALLGLIYRSSSVVSGATPVATIIGQNTPITDYYASVTLPDGSRWTVKDLMDRIEAKNRELPEDAFNQWLRSDIDGGVLIGTVVMRTRDLPLLTVGWTPDSLQPDLLVMYCLLAPAPGPVKIEASLISVACVNGRCMYVATPRKIVPANGN